VNRASFPAFPAVYRDHWARVRRAILRAGVPPRHCDDVVQEAFLRIHEALPRYEPGRKLAPWLLRIAYFAAVDYLRRTEHREEPTRDVDLMAERVETRTPEQAAWTSEAEQLFCALAASLPEPQRIVFLMHEIDDLTVQDIAQALEIPVGTAASRLQRARKDFDAALSRRRVVEERKLGAVAALPLFLIDAEALMDQGRAFPAVSPEASARTWARITRATAKGAAAGALSRLAALAPAQVVRAVVFAGITGSVTGAAVTAAVLREDERVTLEALAAEAPHAAMAPAPRSSETALRGAPAPTAEPAPTAPPAPAASFSSRGPRGPGQSAAAERALLDQARVSLQRGDPSAALHELEKHAARFPDGVHSAERDSMMRQASALVRAPANTR
jgi:RNA polymerase sigma factor (sigma-70 family)